MAELAPGMRVRTRTADPDGHTRLPRYTRGAVGVLVEEAGVHPLADDRARGRAGTPQSVWHVRFAAADLFGSGDHTVTVELWADYLTPIEEHATVSERASSRMRTAAPRMRPTSAGEEDS